MTVDEYVGNEKLHKVNPMHNIEFADLWHYQNLDIVLSETDRLMKAIDDLGVE